jgi:hypothetical protein
VNREWDRIHGVDPFAGAGDKMSASSEVDSALEHPAPRPVAERPFNAKERACSVLGITVEAEFVEIRRSFERLNRRSDPSNFPPGSPEAYQAAQIQRRVQEAYRILIDGMDASELRFRSLEIE